MRLTPSLRTPHSALRTPHSALRTPHSALRTPHSVLRTPHSVLRTPHSVLRTPQSAFTLIELVSVLAIIVVLLSIALGSYYGWARASGIDVAANMTATILSHARELAITQRSQIEVSGTNTNTPNSGRPDCAVFSLYDWGEGGTNAAGTPAMPPCRLPAGVIVRGATPSLWFLPDGTCHVFDGTCRVDDASAAPDGYVRYILDSGGNLTNVVEVTLLSGRVRVLRRGEP